MPPRGTSSPILPGGKELDKIPEKKIKETGKMFKAIGKVAAMAGPYGAAISGVMSVLEPLLPLFQAFEPILTIFNAMFTAFAGALTAELIPALQPLFAALIDMIPIFTELGGIVGGFIAALLVPLVGVLTTIIPIFANFLMNLLQSEEFLGFVNFATALFVSGLTFLIDNIDLVIFFVSGLMGAFVLLTGNLDVLIPFVNSLIVAFSLILPVIQDIVLPALTAFIYMIAIMVDAITLGAAGAVDYVNSIMETIVIPNIPVGYEPPEGIVSPYYPGGPGGPQEFQRGTDVITRTGLFYGHAGEAITPATEVGLQTGLLEEIRDLQREQLLEAKWRMR